MRTPRVAPLAALALSLLALVAFAACGDDDDDGTSAQTDVVTETETETEPAGTAPQEPKTGGEAPRAEAVEMVDFAFEPAKVTIQAGGKVTWKNQGQAPHDAAADDDSFATPTIEPGKLKAEIFDEAGTYPYICTIHPQMTGTIKVVE